MERWQKMALLVLRSVGSWVGQNQMCHLCGWLKLFLKNVRWKKIKIQKRWLFGRLSDGYIDLNFDVLSYCSFYALSSFRLAGNGLQLPEGRYFYHKTSFGELNFRLAQMCLRSTKPRLLGRCCYKLLRFPFVSTLYFCFWLLYSLNVKITFNILLLSS